MPSFTGIYWRVDSRRGKRGEVIYSLHHFTQTQSGKDRLWIEVAESSHPRVLVDIAHALEVQEHKIPIWCF